MSSSGSLLREARLRAGLSQGGLGERTGKDRAQIARWERDADSPLHIRDGARLPSVNQHVPLIDGRLVNVCARFIPLRSARCVLSRAGLG
jgi:Helix-turn-helix